MYTDEELTSDYGFQFVYPNLPNARSGNQADSIAYGKNNQLQSNSYSESIAVFDLKGPFPMPSSSIDFSDSKELRFDSFAPSNYQGTSVSAENVNETSVPRQISNFPLQVYGDDHRVFENAQATSLGGSEIRNNQQLFNDKEYTSNVCFPFGDPSLNNVRNDNQMSSMTYEENNEQHSINLNQERVEDFVGINTSQFDSFTDLAICEPSINLDSSFNSSYLQRINVAAEIGNNESSIPTEFNNIPLQVSDGHYRMFENIPTTSGSLNHSLTIPIENSTRSAITKEEKAKRCRDNSKRCREKKLKEERKRIEKLNKMPMINKNLKTKIEKLVIDRDFLTNFIEELKRTSR